MNPYDADLKPGDRLSFTDEVELHLADLGIPHMLKYGDEMIVVDDDWDRKFPIQIANPKDPTWTAWIFRTIAEGARDFWLKTQELAPENEGVASPLPLAYWSKEYLSLTPEQRIEFWHNANLSNDPAAVWKLLTDYGGEQQA